ncbi:unnamed protein product [Cyprideis torosa]|uniref:RNA (guanine-9-)-methyltransferase domain-containing protein 1 n=1 Tax=Cyprideis torosa TaxID=163714 RepID=A0A7R8W6J5_9CRUS|nr:unnamed protein product [Cyprideis torosa]CAG0881829.1 unnamed protein product [Cyprideis torosa]
MLFRGCVRLLRTTLPVVVPGAVLPTCVPRASRHVRLASSYSQKRQEEHQHLIHVGSQLGYDDLSDLDPERRRKLVMMEYEVLKDMGERVPSELEEEHINELAELGKLQRLRFHLFLFKKEMRKLNAKERKEAFKESHTEHVDNLLKRYEEEPHLIYALNKNTFMIKVIERTMDTFYNYRATMAMLHGHTLIMDCAFSEDLDKREQKLTGEQLVMAFSTNRSLTPEPFNLFFTGLKKNSFTYERMKAVVPTLEQPQFPLQVQEATVQLTDFLRNRIADIISTFSRCKISIPLELEEQLTCWSRWDSDAIYVIGGIVDCRNTAPLTLAKAKKYGLKTRRLPLDKYLEWGLGSKSLTINQVIGILLEFKQTKDWIKAFHHVPRRKLKGAEGLEWWLIPFAVRLRNLPWHSLDGSVHHKASSTRMDWFDKFRDRDGITSSSKNISSRD